MNIKEKIKITPLPCLCRRLGKLDALKQNDFCNAIHNVRFVIARGFVNRMARAIRYRFTPLETYMRGRPTVA
jgi:hypothetical protein